MNLWIFGYGSLCWRPGFEYNDAVIGYIKGYSRKFWQGNTTHRGTVTQPGRVATLVDDESSTVWGCAFEITGEAALSYLMNRECKLGGYMTKFTLFYPKNTLIPSASAADKEIVPMTVMFYVATPKNDLWLGDAPLCEIAQQITECSGESGHNVEYLIKLVDFMRHHVPEAKDDHLYSLEKLVQTKVKEKNLNMKILMGKNDALKITKQMGRNSPEPEQRNDPAERANTFQYVARVPEKNLRCLNI